MATVYLAQDLKHDRKVAIKVLRAELAAAGFHQSYDVAADGRSFLFVSPRRATATGAPQVVWVDNWFKDLANRRTR